MEINVISKDVPVCRAVCHIKNDFTTECDVIVPDLKPDIKRVLEISATVKVTGCETQNSRIIVSGNICYNILYLSDTEEKEVKSIDGSCVFSNLFQDVNIKENMLSICDVSVNDLQCTLINCRKLTLKIVLEGKADVYSPGKIQAIENIENAKIKKTEISSSCISALAESYTTIVDSFEIPRGNESISEILKISGKITESDIKIIDDKAIIKGVLKTVILYRGEKSVCFTENEIPFAYVVDASGIRSDMLTDYEIKITELKCDKMPDGSGEMRSINISAELFFRVVARSTERISLVEDAYIPRGSLECKRKKYNISGIENTVENDVAFRETVNLPESLAPIDTVYEVIASPIVEKCEISGDKLTVTGYIEIYVLYLSNESEYPVFSYKENVDFSSVTDNPDCTLVPYAKCCVKNLSFIISGERSIEVRGNVKISTRCMREREISLIEEVKEAEYTQKKRPSVIISFVPEGRTLWDIAKEYNINEEDIISANALENGDNIESGTALIIPK